MPPKDEILLTLIVEKREPQLISLLSPFLSYSGDFKILIIDNASTEVSIDELARQHPQIMVHARPHKIPYALGINIALEIALHEGYGSVFIWDFKAHTIFPESLQSLSSWSQSSVSHGLAITFEESFSLYIPIEIARNVGLLCPILGKQSAISRYLKRIISHSYPIGDFPKQRVTNQLPTRYKDGSPLKLLDQFSNLKKSLRYPIPLMDIQGVKRAYNRKKFAPVLLLVYNRPLHTKRILNDFWMQPEAPHTPLYILSDGGEGIDEVRKICQQMSQQHTNITLWLQETNQGLAKNVTNGVERVLELHDSVIVLEDDLRLSPYFLRWMNDALETYQHHPEVTHLHAGTFYTHPDLSHNHALHFAGSWGWATWRECWQTYWEADGSKLLRELEAQRELQKRFDYGGFMRFTQMLRRQTKGENNSWAIRWHASLLLNHRLSINSNPPLVSNDGFDGSGTHCGADDRYNTGVYPYPLYALAQVETTIKESEEARNILLRYYRRSNNKLAKAWYKLKELLSR